MQDHDDMGWPYAAANIFLALIILGLFIAWLILKDSRKHTAPAPTRAGQPHNLTRGDETMKKLQAKRIAKILRLCSAKLQGEFDDMTEEEYNDGVADGIVMPLQSQIDATISELQDDS